MKKYLLVSMVLLVAWGCNKNIPDVPSTFNVTASATTINAGDTVNFKIVGGNADQITFYSGEPGNNYDNVNRVSAAGIPKLVFQAAMQQGAAPPPATDSLRLMIATNLSGYDSASVVAANWVDITKRNTKWPAVLSNSFTTSDSIDLSDFNSYDSVNIAFRVKNKQQTNHQQRRWQIQGFALNNYLADGTNTALFAAPFMSGNIQTTAFKYVGWVQVSLLNNYDSGYNVWNVGSWNTSASNAAKNSNGILIKSNYPITFDPGIKLNNPDNDDWLITSKVNLKQVNPDFGINLKAYNSLSITSYQKTFLKSGVYKVTFIAQNNNKNGSSNPVVRQMTITVN